MSRAGLTSAFRRHMGRSVGDYLSDYRVLVAKRELSLGRPVALVSDELGYASPAAFTRMFTARAGRTPREWAARGCAATRASDTAAIDTFPPTGRRSPRRGGRVAWLGPRTLRRPAE